MSEVKRFEMEKEYSLDINIVPTEYPDGSFVHYDDYAAIQEQLAQRDAQIAKLERDEMQLIAERDHAEDALADMYQAATGKRPEWSNWFSFADAVEEVESQNSELRAQIAALTAENVALKEAAKSAVQHWAAAESGSMERLMDKCMPVCREAVNLTPATDAAANALRAEGVEMAISQAFMDGIPVNRMQFIARMTAFANQLREGK